MSCSLYTFLLHTVALVMAEQKGDLNNPQCDDQGQQLQEERPGYMDLGFQYAKGMCNSNWDVLKV